MCGWVRRFREILDDLGRYWGQVIQDLRKQEIHSVIWKINPKLREEAADVDAQAEAAIESA